MKKVVSVIAVLVLALALVGCGSQAPAKEEEVAQEKASEYTLVEYDDLFYDSKTFVGKKVEVSGHVVSNIKMSDSTLLTLDVSEGAEKYVVVTGDLGIVNLDSIEGKTVKVQGRYVELTKNALGFVGDTAPKIKADSIERL